MENSDIRYYFMSETYYQYYFPNDDKKEIARQLVSIVGASLRHVLERIEFQNCGHNLNWIVLKFIIKNNQIEILDIITFTPEMVQKYLSLL